MFFNVELSKMCEFILPGILQTLKCVTSCLYLDLWIFPRKKKNLSSVFNRFASRPEGIRLQIRPSSTEPYCISLLSHFLLLPTVLEQSRATLSVNFWKEKKHYEILLLLFGHHPHVVFEMSHYFTPQLQTALPPFIWLQDHVKYFGARF